jgi:hypothetical protein
MAKSTQVLTHETLLSLMKAYKLSVFPRNGGSLKDVTVSISDPKGNRFFIDRKQIDGEWQWTLGKPMVSKKVTAPEVQVAEIA